MRSVRGAWIRYKARGANKAPPKRGAGGAEIVPRVDEIRFSRQGSQPLGAGADIRCRFNAYFNGIRRYRACTKPRFDDVARQAVPTACQPKQVRFSAVVQLDEAVCRMKQRQARDLVDECAVTSLILAMRIGCNTATDGNAAVPGLNFQKERSRDQEFVERVERKTAFYLDHVLFAVEIQYAVE